jgi:hypothetical protein
MSINQLAQQSRGRGLVLQHGDGYAKLDILELSDAHVDRVFGVAAEKEEGCRVGCVAW